MFEDWSFFLSMFPEAATRLGVALLCGLLLGVERERKNKPAGLRTIVLITIGATLFMIVSDAIAVLTEGPDETTRVDPSRIAAQVVTGIGFLGGGAIIRGEGAVHGLTTAAAIWVAAGIGLCIGIGLPLLGILITVLVLVVLIAMDPLGTWLSQHGDTEQLTLVIPDDSLTFQRVKDVLRQHGIAEEKIAVSPHDADHLRLEFTYYVRSAAVQRLTEALAHIDAVRGISCLNQAEGPATT